MTGKENEEGILSYLKQTKAFSTLLSPMEEEHLSLGPQTFEHNCISGPRVSICSSDAKIIGVLIKC